MQVLPERFLRHLRESFAGCCPHTFSITTPHSRHFEHAMHMLQALAAAADQAKARLRISC